MKPSSTPRAAPTIPNEKTANHMRQFKISRGSSPTLTLKMSTGFFPTPVLRSGHVFFQGRSERGLVENKGDTSTRIHRYLLRERQASGESQTWGTRIPQTGLISGGYTPGSGCVNPLRASNRLACFPKPYTRMSLKIVTRQYEKGIHPMNWTTESWDEATTGVRRLVA